MEDKKNADVITNQNREEDEGFDLSFMLDSTLNPGCKIAILACGVHRYIGAVNLAADMGDSYVVHDSLLYLEVADQRVQSQTSFTVTPKMIKPYQMLELPFFSIVTPDAITFLEAARKGHRQLADLYETQVKAYHAESIGIIAPTLGDIANAKG